MPDLSTDVSHKAKFRDRLRVQASSHRADIVRMAMPSPRLLKNHFARAREQYQFQSSFAKPVELPPAVFEKSV
jgi:hypothetical protein